MSIDLPTFDRQSDTKTWHCDVFASLLRIYGCFHEKKFPCPVFDLIRQNRANRAGNFAHRALLDSGEWVRHNAKFIMLRAMTDYLWE